MTCLKTILGGLINKEQKKLKSIAYMDIYGYIYIYIYKTYIYIKHIYISDHSYHDKDVSFSRKGSDAVL